MSRSDQNTERALTAIQRAFPRRTTRRKARTGAPFVQIRTPRGQNLSVFYQAKTRLFMVYECGRQPLRLATLSDLRAHVSGQ